VRLQKCLLRGMDEGAVKIRATGHAPHRENLQLSSFPGEIGVSVVPIHAETKKAAGLLPAAGGM
jgi:hypothetical protein